MQRLDRFGRFLILEELRSDGAGTCYRVAQAAKPIETFLHLRMLPAQLGKNADLAERLRRTAQAGSGLSHLNLTRVEGTGNVDGTLFLAREHLPGTTLLSLLARCKKEMYPLGADHIVFLAAALVSALDYLHGRKLDGERVTHAGICPLTIGVSYEGEVKLCDWELYQSLPRDLTLQLLAPHMAYVAPEVRAGGPVLARSNMYSLGALLFEVLTRKPPPVEAAGDVAASVNLKSLFSAAAADRVKEVLRRSLHPDPEKRYEDIRDIKAALDDVVAQEGIEVSAFNFAFFMHTLFREEADEETEKLDLDRAIAMAPEKPEAAPDPPGSPYGESLEGEVADDRTIHLPEAPEEVETIVEEEVEVDNSDDVTIMAESSSAFIAAASGMTPDDDRTVLGAAPDDERTMLGTPAQGRTMLAPGKPLPLIKPVAMLPVDDEPLPELDEDEDEATTSGATDRPKIEPPAPVVVAPVSKKLPEIRPKEAPAPEPPRPTPTKPEARKSPELQKEARPEPKKEPPKKEPPKKEARPAPKPAIALGDGRPAPAAPGSGKKIVPLIIIGAALIIALGAGILALIFRPKPGDTDLPTTHVVETGTAKSPTDTTAIKHPSTITTAPALPPTTTPVIVTKPVPPPTTTTPAPPPTTAPDEEAIKAERQKKDLAAAMDDAKKLAAANKFDDALTRLADLEKTYPDLSNALVSTKEDIDKRKDDFDKKAAAEKAKAEADAKAAEERAKAEVVEKDAKAIEAMMSEGRLADAKAALDANGDLMATPRGSELRTRMDAAITAASPKVKEGDIVEENDPAAAPPRAQKKVEPKYPPIAKNRGVSGKVVVHALVAEDGRVVETKVLTVTSTPSGNWGFQQAAEDAAKGYIFFPAMKDGVKVKMWVEIPFAFKSN